MKHDITTDFEQSCLINDFSGQVQVTALWSCTEVTFFCY